MRIKFKNTEALQIGPDITTNGDQNIKIRFDDDDLDQTPFETIQPSDN